MGERIDGTSLARTLLGRLKAPVDFLKNKGIVPGLDVILVGDNPASQAYVNLKRKRAQDLGFGSRVHVFPAHTPGTDLMSVIEDLNRSPETHGILLQLPLPHPLDAYALLNAIAPEKDVDGLTDLSQGRLMAGRPLLTPCTPQGCLLLLRHTLGNLEGRHAVIVGRSPIVGKPLGQLLLRENCTVTQCHSKTQRLRDLTKLGDIVVVAVGHPGLVTADWIKPGACVLDVGITRTASGLVGDVDYNSVIEKAGFLTPVPGGVGPMTIACLLRNTVKAAFYQNNLEIPLDLQI